MVRVFKTDKYLKGIKTLPSGIKINCNAGVVSTNCMGTYGKLKVWYLPGGIDNIFLMHKLEKLYQITYDSWEGHYIIHTSRGAVKFYKDKQGLLYINLEASPKAAAMLLQSTQPEETTRIETVTTLVQTVRENYEGYTKREVLKAKGGALRTGHDWQSEQRRLQKTGEQQHDLQLPDCTYQHN
jgi:hypothetical protein